MTSSLVVLDSLQTVYNFTTVSTKCMYIVHIPVVIKGF